jgi:hypothetical protein
VAYTPDWEQLAAAISRLRAIGVSEEQARLDLCGALADRKLGVRVRVEGGRLFANGNVGVPSHLHPDDFDWKRSRPLSHWLIGPQLGEHYSWQSGWQKHPIDLIEVSTADVLDVLCDAVRESSADVRQVKGQQRRPKLDAVHVAINDLYPDGVPDPVRLPNKELCRHVVRQLHEMKLSKVSDSTILRAAGRRRR